ncbi:MAG: hypothetical protein EPN85_06900 [Bacteroidetes bacterium]|nr:MAG: hypothetical protein EPN85_06900 [Bacteroidota bacterium]
MKKQVRIDCASPLDVHVFGMIADEKDIKCGVLCGARLAGNWLRRSKKSSINNKGGDKVSCNINLTLSVHGKKEKEKEKESTKEKEKERRVLKIIRYIYSFGFTTLLLKQQHTLNTLIYIHSNNTTYPHKDSVICSSYGVIGEDIGRDAFKKKDGEDIFYFKGSCRQVVVRLSSGCRQVVVSCRQLSSVVVR